MSNRVIKRIYHSNHLWKTDFFIDEFSLISEFLHLIFDHFNGMLEKNYRSFGIEKVLIKIR